MNKNHPHKVDTIIEDGVLSHYEYEVYYLNSIKKILTSEPLPLKKGDALLTVNNGGSIGAIIRNVITKERKSLGVTLYGHAVFRKNGNGLDYRKENCVPFSMSSYNANYRSYPNPLGAVGITKSLNGYYWKICRDGKVYYGKERFHNIDQAIEDRTKTINLPLKELKAKCNFKKW